MKFRDHPQLSCKGVPSWPPVWVNAVTLPEKILNGEIGILTDVTMRDFESRRVFLTITHDDSSYLRVLFFDGKPFSLRTFDFLQSRIGRYIEDIGNMEFN